MFFTSGDELVEGSLSSADRAVADLHEPAEACGQAIDSEVLLPFCFMYCSLRQIDFVHLFVYYISQETEMCSRCVVSWKVDDGENGIIFT